MNCKISIIIPVKNGETTLKGCLESIFNQTLINECEVIIIDSGSTDETLEVLKSYPVNLYKIAPEAFNHGSTRNYGVSLAKGEFIYFTVQDAIAYDSRLLERMLLHFSDPAVAAVAGRQAVPHHSDKNPHQWFRPKSNPISEIFSFKDTSEFNSLPDDRKRWVCGLDDVNAMYRKDALLKIPFRPIQFAEDMVWASDAYKSGFKIVLDPSARVYHYHHQTYSYAYKVSLFCKYAEKVYLNINPKPKIIVWELFMVIYRNFKYRAHPKWIINQFEFLFGKYKGAKTIQRLISKGEIDNFDDSHFAQIVPQGQQNIGN